MLCMTSYAAVLLRPGLFILYVLRRIFYRRDLTFATTAHASFKGHFKYTPLTAEQEELQTSHHHAKQRRFQPYTLF